VIMQSVILEDAAIGNIVAVSQLSGVNWGTSNPSLVYSLLANGIDAIRANGAYSITIFDADLNENFHSFTAKYNNQNLVDYTLSFEDYQTSLYAAIKTDYDETSTSNWSSITTYYSTYFEYYEIIDIKITTYDAGQKFSSVSVNFDQDAANTWSEIQTFFAPSGTTDFSYIYYDAGQPLFSAAVDYDQASNQTWSRIETFLSSAGVTDYYWTYYDAGQPYFAATVDNDQANAATWSRIDTFFSSADVTDFYWTYYDIGQAVASRLVDYDQANLYSWSQRIVEYGPGGVLLNDYYI
jgi:hypothetical protein